MVTYAVFLIDPILDCPGLCSADRDSTFHPRVLLYLPKFLSIRFKGDSSKETSTRYANFTTELLSSMNKLVTTIFNNNKSSGFLCKGFLP